MTHPGQGNVPVPKNVLPQHDVIVTDQPTLAVPKLPVNEIDAIGGAVVIASRVGRLLITVGHVCRQCHVVVRTT
jgi:hypothetical protein